MSKQNNFQAKHRARKAIAWDMIQQYRGDSYWCYFYTPLSDFFELCTKRELIFLVTDNRFEAGELGRPSSRKELIVRMLERIRVVGQNGLPKWINDLQSRSYFVAENGHGIKI